MYVDESGDPGVLSEIQGNENSKHFILSGLIINEQDWNLCFQRLKELRREIKKQYGLGIREEIHASELIRIQKIESYKKIFKVKRIDLMRYYISCIPIIFSKSKIINVCIDKGKTPSGSYKNYAELAWNRLLQRYDNYLKHEKSSGIVITDQTDENLVRYLLRKMRVFNPIPSKFGGIVQCITDNIVEDPFIRNSQHSYFIQTTDIIAHCLYRQEYPKGSLKKYNIQSFFKLLEPIILKEASPIDKFGIVRK